MPDPSNSPDLKQSPSNIEELDSVPLRDIVDHRLGLIEYANGRSRQFRFPQSLESRFKAHCRRQAMPARVTTTLVTAAVFLTAPLWTASMLGIPESTRIFTLWVSLLVLGPAFLAITAALYKRSHQVWTEYAFMVAFFLEAAAIETLSHHAALAGYRVSPVISAAVPVAVLALGRLPVLRSLLFVLAYAAILCIKDLTMPTVEWPRTPTETLTIAILLNLALVATIFSQVTRRQNWALLQLMRVGAQLDFLTGLPNRSGYETHVERRTRASRRNNDPYSVAVIDLDFFKRVNDRYGHTHGDGVLREVAMTISRFSRRPDDLAARVGGEEFVLFLYDCGRDDALRLAEALRDAVYGLDIENVDSPFGRVTVSIGISSVAYSEPISVTYEKADGALYIAKRSGRNKVVEA